MPANEKVFSGRFMTPLLIGPLLNPINTTMISVALVPISRDLGVSSSTVVWLVASLYLASAIAQPTLGRIGDVLGPRRVYVVGLLVVIAAGLLPSLADGFGAVVASRVLLGIGTSAAYPSVMAMIRRRATAHGVATPPVVLSAISISNLTSAAIGPVLGGLLIALFGWRSIFLVNVPLAVAALLMTWWWVPSDPPRPEGERARVSDLDPVGILLFGATVCSLLVFAMRLDDPTWWLLVVGGVSLAGLVAWELRAARPFIDLRMLVANGGLTRTYLRMFLLYLGFYSMTYGYSQWVQDDAGFSASQAGLLQFPTAALAGVMSFAIARTSKVRGPILVASVTPMLGALMLIGVTSESSIPYLLVLAALFGVAQGLASVSNQQVLYRQAPSDQLGTASGLSRTFVYLGAILSSGVLGATFGEQPSDADMHLVGAIILACSTLCLVLAVTDRTLRSRT
ncbi:MFS transporter [Nocardioides insulae]|uniref:MFS transporter n=1 Tax=Nocardioides insulae TaxID=394734 RepID=UPI00041E1111|nr:MFS transporter [Nocardioides insulae]